MRLSPKSKSEKELPAVVRRWLAPLGAELPPLYLVGGAVRDQMLGRPIKDIDLMCADPEGLARNLSMHHGATLVPFLKKVAAPCFRVVRREDTEDYIDLVPMRGGSPETDLSLRDFTINAMAVEIGPGGGLAEVIDPLEGRRDLVRRCIRAASLRALADDPLRILRAVRFASQLGFVIDEATAHLMAQSAAALVNVAGERICAELLAILETPASADYLRRLDDSGALAVVFPEIGPMKGCIQNTHHHLDVWGHSLAALEACEAILANPADHFGSSAAAVQAYLATGRRTALLKLALLLHDSGKPSSKQVDSAGRITFYGHDEAGARVVETVGRRLRLSTGAAAFIIALVVHHMNLLTLSEPEVRPATVLRWCRRLGDACVAAIILSMADVAAIRGPAADPEWRERHLAWGAHTVRDYFSEFKQRIEAPPLVTGHDLLAIGIAPGPELGRILSMVRDVQQTGEVESREEALNLIKSQQMRAEARQVARKGKPL